MNASSIVGSSNVRIGDRNPGAVPAIIPPSRAANGNTPGDAARLARRDVVARLYAERFASLVKSARRYVGDRDDALDVVQEAFLVLVASPGRQPTRATIGCIVRDLARARRAERALSEEFIEPDEPVEKEGAAYLRRALGG